MPKMFQLETLSGPMGQTSSPLEVGSCCPILLASLGLRRCDKDDAFLGLGRGSTILTWFCINPSIILFLSEIPRLGSDKLIYYWRLFIIMEIGLNFSLWIGIYSEIFHHWLDSLNIDWILIG
jgi:hypothetical protein